MLKPLYGPLFRAREFLRSDPFKGVPGDAPVRRVLQRRSLAERRYVIFFTPRSGSSRIESILRAEPALGLPGEYFSPYNMPRLARNVGATDFEMLVDLVQRGRRSTGHFGFKITYRQILTAFGGETAFHRHFGDAVMFWLIRRDIVAQAVSSSRMVQTALRHLKTPDPDRVEEADSLFLYRPLELKERIRRLRWMEDRTEAYFARHGIEPIRACYESLSALSPREIAAAFSDWLGATDPPDPDPSDKHARVSGGKSVEFAARFRADHARWLARVENGRRPLMDALPAKGVPCPARP